MFYYRLKAKAKKILDAQHNIKQAILKDKDIEVCTHMPVSKIIHILKFAIFKY